MNLSANREPPRLLIFRQPTGRGFLCSTWIVPRAGDTPQGTYLESLETHRSDILAYGWRLSDLARALVERARRLRIFHREETPQEQFNRSVALELCSNSWVWTFAISLEGLGAAEGFTLGSSLKI